MAPPALLAGPILRRVEPQAICLWVATSVPVEVRASVFRVSADGLAGQDPIGSGRAESVRLGKRLWIHLAVVTPDRDSFPGDELLAYDLQLRDEGGHEGRELADLGLLDGPRRITYGDFTLPTFFIRRRLPALNLLHGSCRLLHGKGQDGLLSADEVIARAARDLGARPAALFLTGDQIYGDEVAGPLIRHLSTLGSWLRGPGDPTSVPGVPTLSTLPVYSRQDITTQVARFTSSKAGNHLMSFGEFAAMYVTAWNEATWPAAFPPADEAVPSGRGSRRRTRKLRRQYAAELAGLERARSALPAVRRVLANVPTYMTFDDHDVTDDWNLTRGWCERVHSSPAGRRIVANALASFWAFQGWGNDPDAPDEQFRQQITSHLAVDGTRDGSAFDSAMWSFDRWSCHVPTTPPAVLLDTRSQRRFDSAEGAARLLSEQERGRVLALCRDAGHRPGEPLILVSAVPVFGLELQERRQKFLVSKLGPYEIDFEAWHSNLHGFVDFMQLLTEDVRADWCVLLSGDVHYGLNVHATFSAADREISFVQLVSSSLKHSGALSRVALHLLGRLVTTSHRRVGWSQPPTAISTTGFRQWVLTKAANTDAWDTDSPVFLSPRMARRLRIRQPPDYREVRRYVRPTEPRSSLVVGENNIGLVTYRSGAVSHRLLGRVGDGIRFNTVTIPTGSEDLDELT